MRTRVTRINDWTIEFYFSFDIYDKERLLDALLWADAPHSLISKVSENIDSERLDEGFCYSNPYLRRTVLGTGVASSGPEVLDSMVHEIIHICQHMAEEDGIDPFGESLAYLGGDIARSISDIVCELSCPHCNSRRD